MSTSLRSRLVSTGFYVPERVVTNDDLAALMNTSDSWIRERTGIQERRFALPGQGASHLAFEASKRALDAAGLTAQDVDMIVFATLSPDYFFPGSGVLLGSLLNIPGTPALDVRNQCSGFLYGLQCADAFIRSGMYKRVLLVGSEVHSTGLELNDRGRSVSVIFGDGAGAWILEATPIPHNTPKHLGPGVLWTSLGADGAYAQELWCRSPSSAQHPTRITPEDIQRGDHFPHMNGRKVFKHAVQTMRNSIQEILQDTSMTLDDIDLLIPHQANLRISETVRKALNLPQEKVFNNIQKYGNTTAASIPIATHESIQNGLLSSEQVLCCVAFGSGFTWGVSLIRL